MKRKGLNGFSIEVVLVIRTIPSVDDISPDVVAILAISNVFSIDGLR